MDFCVKYVDMHNRDIQLDITEWIVYNVYMHVARAKWKSKNGKVYESVWLRQSYREGGKVKKRAVLNLKGFSPEEINALELALKYKGRLKELCALKGMTLKQGGSVGAVWVVYEVARRLGVERVLGGDFAGKLGLWQVIARVIDQGSRLSAVRLAQGHVACEILALKRGFSENDLYENLEWLSGRQEEIEKRLFEARWRGVKPTLFLYDVTSSYLEGEENELGAYGHDRDGKEGKKQIIVGLLCDEVGEPVSVGVFKGNTQDAKTFASQVEKVCRVLGCERVAMVGDRGMIKSGQIEELARVGFHYITAITKPQIEALLKAGVLEMELFDEMLCEVEHEGVRYVLRRNPHRVEQLARSRADKVRTIKALIARENTRLATHPRSAVGKAERTVREKIERLRLERWLGVRIEGCALALETDAAALAEHTRLDGCYVLKSDLPPEVADRTTIHERYKDLAKVEQAFRTIKTAHLEMRPIYVRTEESTRGHALVVMLAYLVRRALQRAWASFDLTVEEGLDQLKTLCVTEIQFPDGTVAHQIPEPCDQSRLLLDALGLKLPDALPKSHARVVTYKKLSARRKPP